MEPQPGASWPWPCPSEGGKPARCGDSCGVRSLRLSPALLGVPDRLWPGDDVLDRDGDAKGSRFPPGDTASSSSSTKISGTANVGGATSRALRLAASTLLNLRLQYLILAVSILEIRARISAMDAYMVSKNPITILRRTDSSTSCNRARRCKNSSSLEIS